MSCFHCAPVPKKNKTFSKKSVNENNLSYINLSLSYLSDD